ncbi:MAG: type II toxin-antitoxin system HicB family antitoxin [Verrucomicrobiota bacterium]
MTLSYPVILKPSEEGVAVGCPTLPGCWSQGKDEKEALENIRSAISEYLAAQKELLKGEELREVQVNFS